MQVRLVLGLLASVSGLLGCASPRPAITDLENRPVDPFGAKPGTAVVLIFISNDCPIANRYAPEFNRLQARFRDRGVAFWLVHPDPSEHRDAIRQHARAYHLELPEICDPTQKLVRLAQVAVTPSAAVFLPGGQLVYHGRIDDRFASLSQERPEAQRHDLAEALDAVVQHRPIPEAVTQAFGCYIPEPQRR